MKTERKAKGFVTLNNLHISSNAVVAIVWNIETLEQLGCSGLSGKSLVCCGLSCKEIKITIGTDSFTVRDAMRSQELLAPSGGPGLPLFSQSPELSESKNKWNSPDGLHQTKKGRKLGFTCRSDHILGLAVGYLLCELPLLCISSSWSGESSLVGSKGNKC